MTYLQAFHTSCRSGLSGHSGFQFNAASAGLDERQLSGLAAAHAGYRPAPDAPMEPDAGQIEQLPVSLRYLPVEGVGPVISRTAYVGREFRGRDGEPDSGRFGNYFSHILAAPGSGGPFFDGLMPIELWGAPHWTTTESAATDLPPLERIDPGPVDLERVLAELMPARADSLGPVLDACLRAVLGGPRVVVVEPDPDLASAWIAWVSFALPVDRVGRLTFSTFEGRPRVADAMRICLTTPACDLDFPAYEIGSSVTVVDARAPAGQGLSLYARAAAALAEEGGEAVGAAVRELGPDLDLEQAGAELAVLARRADLVLPEEAACVLATLRRKLPLLSPEPALALMAALPEEVDSPATLAEWSRLHAAARQTGDPDKADLVDLTLERVLAGFRRASEIEPVERESPVAPSVAALARWSGMVSAAAGSDRLGEVIGAGARLRLVGLNSALDRELVATIAGRLGDPKAREAFDTLAAEGNEAVVEGVALEVAAGAGSGGSLAPLRYVARHRVAREAVRAKAERDPSFEMAAAWEVLRVEGDVSRRPAAVARLAELATTERQVELIRGLYSEGPVDPAEHTELLIGWEAAGRSAPPEDCLRALSCLETLPLRRRPAAKSLFTALRQAPKSVRATPEYLSWWLLFASPPSRGFIDWAELMPRARGLLAKMPELRRREVETLAAEIAATSFGEDGYSDGVDVLVDVFGDEWPPELGEALGRELVDVKNPERTIARVFVEWQRCPRHAGVLLEQALPRATRDQSPRRLEAVGEQLGEGRREAWDAWLEEHPPSRAVSRAMRGVLRRGEGKR
ncbi:MAG TPA: hypothetical protein VGV69_08270 [Solirubrobacterales bacterium]|nr:hypothetical protein [Solirubrobacterales bacterium]